MKRRLVCLFGLGLVLGATAHAQSLDKPLQLASREPAFYAIVGSHLERAEARNVAALRARIALRLHNSTIPEALKAIEAQTPLRFAFQPSILPSSATVSLEASDITVAAALTQVLQDADVDVEIAPYGLASIVPRQSLTPAPDTATGTITGRVTDSKTHVGVPYVTLSLEGTSRSTTANDSGSFRLTRVPARTYTIAARRVGYVLSQRSVIVVSGQVTTVDFTLEQSASALDQVVVTGSLVPTTMKSLPTPITVVSDSEISEQQPRTMSQVFREFTPTAVAFDEFAQPNLTFLSVRGATDLNQEGTHIKTIVDGIEVAANDLSPIDPASIDHIEVIRGPEAAAIYGSGAIDGVIQVFTKHGAATDGRPSVDMQVAAGDVQTPYPGFRGVLRQAYSGDVRGGTQDASYTVGGGYTQTNNFLPFGAYSAQSSPSAYGGLHYSKGITTLDVSARYLRFNTPAAFNPEFTRFASSGYTVPTYIDNQTDNATIGFSLNLQPRPEWRNVISVGYDEVDINEAQRRPHLTSPADTELTYLYENENKITLRAYPSYTGHLASGVTGTLTAGADYWTIANMSTNSFGVLNSTIGSIQTDKNIPFSTSRYPSYNTGLFAQGQLDILDALFLTAGLRADWDTYFGDSIGVPVSPRFGIAYSHSLGFSTLKLRSSWGSAILPPSAGAKELQIGSFSVQLANPHLVPERQYGGDVGFDMLFGQVSSFSATYYRQIATDLIQQVQLRSNTIATFQNQNVGSVTNSGVELEGRTGIGRFSLRVMYGFTRSRIDAVAPGYTGDYRVGDQAFDVPRHTGGASLSMRAWHGASIAAGLTYVGPWSDYNNVKLNICTTAFFNTGDASQCPAQFVSVVNAGGYTQRPFLMQYPTLVKGNLNINQALNPMMSAFISIENIGNNERYEGSDNNPRVGRISTVGVRLHY